MIKKFALLILILFVGFVAFSQQSGKAVKLLEKGKASFSAGNYKEAIQYGNNLLKLNPQSLEAHLLLAEIYYDLDSLKQVIFHFVKASLQSNCNPLVFFRLGEVYYKSGEYSQGAAALERYINSNPPAGMTERANKLLVNCRFGVEAMKNPVRFSPVNIGPGVNSKNDEYWPSLTVDGNSLVFTRLIPAEGNVAYKQEDFYASTPDSSGWQPAMPLTDLNTNQNEGAQAVSSDGKLLFYTLCNSPGGFGSCDIWFSRYENGRWTTPRNAGPKINSSAWEGQPSLTANGGALYFSGNRAGGKGNKDIWKAEITGWNDAGLPVWGAVSNLGDSINTNGNEISPFIHPNGAVLFFSSDYWPGLGGFDIFRSQLRPDGSWTKAENLGYPLNSYGNEQGLIIDRIGTTGYLSSNRQAENGMDIYSFEIDLRLRPEPVSFIKGKVINRKTKKPVAATVQLENINQSNIGNIILNAGEQGLFTVVLPVNQSFAFHVQENGFLFYSENFSVTEADANMHIERIIELSPVEAGSVTNLYNIFFETDAFDILPQSEPELQTLVKFLQKNESLTVEIQGHTDNVGTEFYNQQLSEKRALSVLRYLTGHGISSWRLLAKGYGLSQPVETNLTPEGRGKNRRTAVKVISFSPVQQP